MAEEDGAADWQRADLWLWYARVAKTRAECARQIAMGRVRINSHRTDKAHARLRPGDVLTLTIGKRLRVWRVVALPVRRGPATEARALFEDLSEPTA